MNSVVIWNVLAVPLMKNVPYKCSSDKVFCFIGYKVSKFDKSTEYKDAA